MMKAVRKKLWMLGAISALGVSIAAQQAQAVPMLKLSDGDTVIEIVDGGALDTVTDAGVIGYSGAVGNFMMNFMTALTKPAIGSAELPLMDIISFNSTTLGDAGGTLTIMMTETDFEPLNDGNGNLTYHSSIGGTTVGNVSFQTYRDDTNTPYGMDMMLADLGPLSGSPLAFSGHSKIKYHPDVNYSLTMVVTVEHEEKNQNTSFNAEFRGTPNPEPVTGVLGFMGLGALSMAMRRRMI